ncbi:Sensor histidine kinase RcsC [Caballeronia sp. SBC1]|nr:MULTISPECIES: response regulator [unclassified Caballeronia]QIE24143.1 Sensor histidine kinase RcsC [Caballeronia sp. SBC2]QIN62039.1 Sensor histidine kinase RcsC [Caballeronia sp. SBC1]
MAKQHSLTFRMTAFIVLVCALLVGTDIWRSLAARQVQLKEMTSATANLARAMAQHANDTIKESDTALMGIDERVEHDGTSPAALERLRQLFSSRLNELPQLNGLFVFDRTGQLIMSSEPGKLHSYNNADRDYFIYHQSHADRGARIGGPLLSRSTGKWAVPVSRRIVDADGSFAGVVVATIDIDFFLRFYNSLDIGHAGAAALVLNNGRMIVRRPFESRFQGTDVSETVLFHAHQAAKSGTFLTKSSQDGVVRLNSFRSLQDYPLFVAAALSQQEILAAWWTDTLWHSAGVGALVIALALFGFRLIRLIGLRTVAEERLAASLDMTRAILDTAINPIITIDSAGIVSSLNPAGENTFGYASQELVGRNVRTLVPDSLVDAYNDYVAQFSRQGRTGSGSGRELAGLRKDGSIFPAHVSTAPMVVAGELCFVCVITDLTEQHGQRMELAAARDQVLLAAQTAELGIWSWNLADNALHWNERMFEIYEQPKTLNGSGLNFDHWRTRVHPADIDATMNSLNAAIEGNGDELPLFRITLPGGRIRYIQTRMQVERDANGTPVVMTGINRDITDQHQLELRLREAKEQADAASAAKSSFLANMSHEIRTPMNAVLGMLHLVQLSNLNLRQRDYVSKAQTAAKSLLGLLNDILDYSKIDAGKLQLDVHPFELEPLMQDLGVVLSGNQGDKNVEVLFDLDSALPNSLIGDSLRLQQVLINLAGNALKFTLTGQVIVSVELLQRVDATVRVRIAVTDSGIGISGEQTGRIFEGFNQAETSTTRRFGGSGLGLVICKRLVGLMGGDLQVESEVGVGSRFWFDITLGVDGASTPVTAPVIDRPLRLLVADDNQMAGELLVRTVAALGWQADFVCGGIDAVKKISESVRAGQPYDVVLMDWRMPDLDGLNAAKLIRGAKDGVPLPVVVMVTAYGREVLAEARDSGEAPFVGFLTKPITPRQLSDVVLRALSAVGTRPPELQELASRPAARLAGLNLLVVEDNALNRQVAEGVLRAEGAQVQLAEGGIEGVRRATTAGIPFDAVLMDIQMPDIDGFEATRRIRANPRCATLPIIAMTANASNADRQACLHAGMNDHVGKPIDVELLVSVLHAQIDGRKSPLAFAPYQAPSGVEVITEPLVETKASIVARFGGNIALINSVLDNFGSQTEKQLMLLSQQIAHGEPLGAASVLHAIKGTAGTVGARALSARAGQLEYDLRHADASATNVVITDEGVADLRDLLRDSVTALAHEFEDDTIEAPFIDLVLPLAEWKLRLNEIVAFLESSNLQAVALAEALVAHTGSEQRDQFDQFLMQVRELDFAVAALSARDMLERS